MIDIRLGDCRDVLKTLPDESVHCVVTSPPYWGLRDYGVVGQIGLEPTFDAFIAEMVSVFREVRRVLRSDGTLWLNLGDSYATRLSGDGWGDYEWKTGGSVAPAAGTVSSIRRTREQMGGLKPKDLCGIPWRVAFALQADGWWLRQDIIWAKPNPMPESVTDRCTKAHEYIFLLSKSARYYYDNEAIREPHEEPERSGTPEKRWSPRLESDEKMVNGGFGRGKYTERLYNPAGRNKRSVWEVATAPFSEAHFATFPPELIDPAIKVGCPDKCCPHCGKGWERQISKAVIPLQATNNKRSCDQNNFGAMPRANVETTTLGWSPTCSCPAHQPTQGTVLDPFGGAGTTGLVADRLQRNAILIELNPEYASMARKRVQGDCPLFAEMA